jgi:hypothetical protein
MTRAPFPLIAALFVALAPHALAGPTLARTPSPLEPAFGATIVSTHPDGRQARLWLNRDGSYAAQGRAGQRSGGVWALKGEKLCLTQKAPMPVPLAFCKRFPAVAVGAHWPDRAVNGEAVINSLVAGRRP